jgi:hypothetical protein
MAISQDFVKPSEEFLASGRSADSRSNDAVGVEQQRRGRLQYVETLGHLWLVGQIYIDVADALAAGRYRFKQTVGGSTGRTELGRKLQERRALAEILVALDSGRSDHRSSGRPDSPGTSSPQKSERGGEGHNADDDG